MRSRAVIALASAFVLAAPAAAAAADHPVPSSSPTADPDGGDMSFRPLDSPQRVLDTREGASTADGQLVGAGRPEPGSTLVVPVAGRVGVPADADTVAVNVTAVEAEQAGFVTLFPCDEDRPNASNLNVAAGDTIAVGALARIGVDGAICVHTSTATHLVVDVTGYFPAGAVSALEAPQRLLDTRESTSTIDGRFEGIGTREPGSTLTLDVAGRGDVPESAGDTPLVAALSVTAVGGDVPGFVTVFPCDGDRPNASSLNHAAGETVANAVVSRVDADGAVCLYSSAAEHLIVDAAATIPATTYAPLERPRRLLDTRAPGSTIDGRFSGAGLRPQQSTLQLDVAGRAGVPEHAGAALLNVTAVEARNDGFVTVHPPGVERPTASNLNVATGDTMANVVPARLGTDGAVCLHTDASAHLVVDVVGWFPGTPSATTDQPCPEPPLFPTYRMVALYGSDADARLGVLGEQPPEAAAARLAEVIEPWVAESDRPVLGMFELIATIALSFPGEDGLYRSVGSADRVQRYLDAARAHGYQLVLDIQPGRSDFPTEVARYEDFLREPDVHVALDPEWRVGPGIVPGESVGQVSAAEVNDVARYLADIVAEEDLPQKLLIVHQFQDRMITDRHELIAPPELAVNIHMDGFGTRAQKLGTYSVTRADPPFWNGFKLFYDEDVNMFSPSDVLALDPVPDYVSYQ